MKIYRTLTLLLLTAATAAGCGSAREAEALAENLIPMPRSIEITGRRLVTPAEMRTSLDAPDEWDDEQYSIVITPSRIEIRAKTEQGAVWAHRTLEQLRDSAGRLPQVRIDDRPEFPIRGFLWDDGRNFVGTETLRSWLDMMSACKVNTFQWHLTDHPAWRIECRCHPQLNDPRFQRRGRSEGSFYTYDEIRETIAYARERGITVIPEIDMPGHSTYFTAAFGCTMDSERGRAILEECIDEFCREIPAGLCPCIHIGSDEVHVADPEGFMAWAQTLLRSRGRTTMVWDPGLPADSLSIRQIWRDGSPDDSQIRTDTPFVDSSMGYLNYYDPLLFTAKLFFHTPCYTGVRSEAARGGILCMWNDVRTGATDRIIHQNGMAAALLTFAERLWSGGATAGSYIGTLLPAGDTPEAAAFGRFQRRLQNFSDRFWGDAMEFWTPLGLPEWSVRLEAGERIIETSAHGDIIDLDALCRRFGVDDGCEVSCLLTRTICSPCDTVLRFRAGFDSPARSNRISDGIPPRGEWPNRGFVRVNGRPVPPPEWREPDSYRFHFNTWARPEEEFPYTDEQLYWLAEPREAELHRGENTVEMGVTRHFRGQRFHAAFVGVR